MTEFQQTPSSLISLADKDIAGIESLTGYDCCKDNTANSFTCTLMVCFYVFLIVLLFLAMSCHCSVCVHLSHSIKDSLLTYLLT